MEKKINITSTVVEKGIDLVKNFLDKLIIPAVEETGLLLRDKVTYWKFKNQVRMLNKAKSYCEKNNISPKTISLKVLCPLLDYSALEEDENLQDKWAILLANMVDSEQNIENHVFPYTLSQISSNEFELLDNVFKDRMSRKVKFAKEIEVFKTEKPKLISALSSKIAEVEKQIEKAKADKKSYYDSPIWDLTKEKRKLEREIKSMNYKESHLKYRMNKLEVVPEDSLEEFEISNLMRLGLIKYVQRPFANSQTLEIPYDPDEEHHGYLTVDLEVDVESEEEYVLSELGELFIEACSEKKKK